MNPSLNESFPTEPLPLSVQVSSPEELDVDDCGASEHQHTPEKVQPGNLIIKNDGLLTYSTPILSSAQQRRAPRVNFHSIDDIVNGGNKTSPQQQQQQQQQQCNDSGFSSFASVSSPYVNTSYLTHHRLAENTCSSFSDDLDEKENDDISVKHSLKIEAHINNNNNLNNKKNRTTFTDEQKRALDVYFVKNPYPDPAETQELSEQLVLPENVIKVWFQNKRSRDKQRKFSHSNRMLNKLINAKTALSPAPLPTMTSSPIVNNLQMLHSKFNTYAALAAVVNAAKQNHNFYNNFQN